MRDWDEMRTWKAGVWSKYPPLVKKPQGAGHPNLSFHLLRSGPPAKIAVNVDFKRERALKPRGQARVIQVPAPCEKTARSGPPQPSIHLLRSGPPAPGFPPVALICCDKTVQAVYQSM